MKIQVLFDIETQLVKALPKMAEAATDMELQKTFLDHLSETKNHVSRLEQIFAKLGETEKKESSDGIRGIVKDGKWVINHVEPEVARDASLVSAARHVEHYEISAYSGAITLARELGESDISILLETTLNEEKAADEKLAQLGEVLDRKVMMDADSEKETLIVE